MMKLRIAVVLLMLGPALVHANTDWSTPGAMLNQGATEVLATVTGVNLTTDDGFVESGMVLLHIDQVFAGQQVAANSTIAVPFVRRLGVQDESSNWEDLAPNDLSLQQAISGLRVVAFLRLTPSGLVLFPSGNAVHAYGAGALLGTIIAVDSSSNRNVTLRVAGMVSGYVPGTTVSMAYPPQGTSNDRYVDPVVGNAVYVDFQNATIAHMENLPANGFPQLKALDAQTLTLVGDVNQDGLIDCSDVAAIRAAFGKRVGATGYSGLADLNNDGIVDIRDLVIVTSKLTAGTVCQ